MQNLLTDTQYAFCTTNMWFNFKYHHLHEYAAMETQIRATQANHYRINRFIIEKKNYRETIDYREYCLSHYRDSKKKHYRSALPLMHSQCTCYLHIRDSV